MVVAKMSKEYVDVNAAVALFVFFPGHFKCAAAQVDRVEEGRLHFPRSGVFQSSPSQVNRTHHRVKQQAAAAALHLYRGPEGRKNKTSCQDGSPTSLL